MPDYGNNRQCCICRLDGPAPDDRLVQGAVGGGLFQDLQRNRYSFLMYYSHDDL
jgi:hypothetical protein